MSTRRIAAAGLATGLAAFTLASLANSPAAAAATRVDTGRQALVSYNATFVPAGATARVRAIATASGKTVVTLQVRGLSPNREYGSHAHQFACGATGAIAGGHYQYVVDPVQPSTDDAYANPQNEIWLDFTTDSEGNGSAQTVVEWQFPADRRAQSVIIHDHHTPTGPDGSAGVAGPRYGCLSVPF